MRLIDLDEDANRIAVTFPYDRHCVAAIRSVRGATFDREGRRWLVPVDSMQDLVIALEPLRFKLSPALREIWTESDAPINRESEVMKLSELNSRIYQAVGSFFPSNVWVDCEIDGFDRVAPTGHAFFELVERRDGRIATKLGAILFEQTRIQIENALRGIGVEFKDGMLLRLEVRPSFHAPNGSLRAEVCDVDLSTLQDSEERRREKILKELSLQGDLSANRRIRVSPAPLRIGVITSVGSDAAHDFIDELAKSGWGFQVSVFGAAMQGMNLERSVLQGLDYFGQRSNEFDVVAIVRGGGARSDLAWFDSYNLGLAVMRHPLRVLTGIGHHRDECVLDRVASPAKTPTAAAQILVTKLNSYRESWMSLSRSLERAVQERVALQFKRLDRSSNRLPLHVSGLLTRHQVQLERLESRLRRGSEKTLESSSRHLDILAAKTAAADPREAIKRGFVLVERDGKIIKRAAELDVGSRVELFFSDGSRHARVEE